MNIPLHLIVIVEMDIRNGKLLIIRHSASRKKTLNQRRSKKTDQNRPIS